MALGDHYANPTFSVSMVTFVQSNGISIYKPLGASF